MGGAAPRQRSGIGRALLILLAVFLVIGLVWAVIAGIALVAGRTKDRQLATESSATSVRVDNPCGSITLQQGEAGAVRTQARARFLFREPSITSELDGDTVVVDVDCPSFSPGTSVSLVVLVPPGGSVAAHSSAGSVSAAGLDSDLDLSSSAGGISATDIRSTSVVARTSAGSVSLSWASGSDPQRVDASSSAGSVRVAVPDVAGAAWRVDADSSAGSTTVDVRTDPGSQRTIRATSSAGSVVVEYR